MFRKGLLFLVLVSIGVGALSIPLAGLEDADSWTCCNYSSECASTMLCCPGSQPCTCGPDPRVGYCRFDCGSNQ